MAQYRDLTPRDRTIGYSLLALGCAVLLGTAVAIGNQHPLWFFGVLVVVFGALLAWHSHRFGYRCPSCGAEFSVTPLQNLLALHAAEQKYLTCPQCKRKDWAKLVAKTA